MKNELIEFLDWLSEEGNRWYSIEKEYDGEKVSDWMTGRYLKEKDEEVGKSGKVQ